MAERFMVEARILRCAKRGKAPKPLGRRGILLNRLLPRKAPVAPPSGSGVRSPVRAPPPLRPLPDQARRPHSGGRGAGGAHAGVAARGRPGRARLAAARPGGAGPPCSRPGGRSAGGLPRRRRPRLGNGGARAGLPAQRGPPGPGRRQLPHAARGRVRRRAARLPRHGPRPGALRRWILRRLPGGLPGRPPARVRRPARALRLPPDRLRRAGHRVGRGELPQAPLRAGLLALSPRLAPRRRLGLGAAGARRRPRGASRVLDRRALRAGRAGPVPGRPAPRRRDPSAQPPGAPHRRRRGPALACGHRAPSGRGPAPAGCATRAGDAVRSGDGGLGRRRRPRGGGAGLRRGAGTAAALRARPAARRAPLRGRGLGVPGLLLAGGRSPGRAACTGSRSRRSAKPSPAFTSSGTWPPAGARFARERCWSSPRPRG